MDLALNNLQRLICRKTQTNIHNAKAIFAEKHWDGIQPIAEQYNGVHAFPKGICLKVNVIAWLEFELIHYDVAIQHRGIRGFMPFPRVLVWKWM